jgi:hypothetical protein
LIVSEQGTEVCKNQAGVIYEAETIGNKENYRWSLAQSGGSIIAGGMTNRAVIDWGSQSGTYDISLKTIDTLGCGNYSTESIVVNESESPGASNIIYKNTGSLLIVEDDDADFYQFGRTLKTDLSDAKVLSQNTTDRYIVIAPADTTEYYYWVDTWFEGGELCKSRSYYNGNPVSIEDLFASGGISVFPNPTTGDLHLQVGDHFYGACELKIFSLDGNCMLSKSVVLSEAGLKIDFGFAPTGLYVLKLMSTDQMNTIKVLKY